MALARFKMTYSLLSDGTGPFSVDATAGNAYVEATSIDLRDHVGKMVVVTDSSGYRAWGILSSTINGTMVYVETLPNADDQTFCEKELGFTEANTVSIAIVITTPPYQNYSADTHKAQTRTGFGGGYVQSRPMHTRHRDAYTLRWRGLDATTLQTFIDFFTANQGNMFLMTRPLQHTTMLARFARDSVSWPPLTPSHSMFEAQFEEV